MENKKTNMKFVMYEKHDVGCSSVHYPLSAIRSPQRGLTILLVVVFMGVFTLILGTITSYVFEQAKYGRALYEREQALHIAEAGLEYYRWFLAHNPSIMNAGVGLVSPYTYTANDPEGGSIGSSVVTATTNLQCGVVQWIELSSVGRASANPTFARTLKARYMKPSVGEFSNMINSNVWAGADRSITGPYFSNGGIRMDGTNNSTVSSAVPTWQCDSSFGCSPTQSKPGVWGAGSGSILWKYPVSTFDFTGIATNFSTLKTYAQTSGIMLNPQTVQVGGVQQGGSFTSVGANDQRGFHLVFNSNGTVSVYRVTGTSGASSLHVDDLNHWQTDYYTITSQTLVGTYAVPSGCSLIYSQARTWIEGTVAGKATVVAADTGNYDPDIILNGNIGYTAIDGTVGLTAVAEHSVVYGLQVPDQMSVRGVFVAQSGYYGRNLYDCSYTPYDKRTSLTTNGTVVSNGRIGTQWTYSGVSGCPSNSTSGFLSRTDNYDRLLAFSPPPFTPSASTNYGLVLWREQ